MSAEVERLPVVVAHVVLGLRIGGLERVVVDLVKHSGRRVRPAVICIEERGQLGDELVAGGAPLVVVPRRPGFRPWHAFRVRGALRQLGAEVVHTHNTAAGLYGGLGARLSGLPVVHTKHGANIAGTPRQGLLNWLAFKLTDHVVAVSEAAREIARAEGIEASRLSIIDNGIDTARFAPQAHARASARDELSLPVDAFVVGSVARLSQEKNQSVLLEAFSLLVGRDQGAAARLVLVGGGPMEADLRSRAASLGVGERVVFAGPRQDVAELLPAFDVFALSSDTEGLPVALLEAMAAGVAPVVTRVGAMAEVVGEGRAGLVVEPRDPAGLAAALARLRDQAFRQQLSSEARSRVLERYDARRMAGQYEALYWEVLRGRR